MIYRRREGGIIRPGVNVLWSPLAKNVILRTPWFSLDAKWNRHTRRLNFGFHEGLNWTPIWNPWRRARELQAQLDRANRYTSTLEAALCESADRYDRIREANAQLRETLTLYRSEAQQ